MPSLSVWTAALVTLLASVAGCRLAADVITIPAEGATALIFLAKSSSGATAEAVALDDPAHPFVSLPAPSEAGVTWYVLRYGCTLDALGVRAGRLALSSSAEARPLPTPDTITVATPAPGSDVATWSPLADAPDELRAIHLDEPAGTSCVELDYRRIRLTGTATESIDLLVRAGDREVLVGTGSGHFYRADETGAARFFGLDARSPRFAATRDTTGRIFVVGRGGYTVVGDLARGFTTAPKMLEPSPRRRAALDAAHGDAPFELFAACDGPSIQRFDGTAWTLIATPSTSTTAEQHVAWAAPGEAWIANEDEPTLGHVVNGTYTEEPSPLAIDDHPTALRFVDGIGVVLGSNRGFVDRWDGAERRWVRLRGSVQAARALAGLASTQPEDAPASQRMDGLLFGGLRGALDQWHPSDERCTTAAVTPGGNVYRMEAVLGGVFGLSREDDVGGDHVLTWIIPRGTLRPPAACE